MCIVTGRDAIAVSIPLECRFVTQSLTSPCLCWCPQDVALSTAFMTETEKLLSCESLRYTLSTRTSTVIWLCWRNKLVIFPVKVKYPSPENVGRVQDSLKSPLEASLTVLKRQKATRVFRKIPAIEILARSTVRFTACRAFIIGS